MLQLYDVIKYAVLQQLPEAGTHPQLPEIPGMDRCQHPDTRAHNLPYRFQLRLSPQLVHRHDLRIHHSQQQRHALILGTAGQHIGAGSQIQRVFPLPLGCQLPADLAAFHTILMKQTMNSSVHSLPHSVCILSPFLRGTGYFRFQKRFFLNKR